MIHTSMFFTVDELRTAIQVLGGGEQHGQPPRNLKVARLLLERGACPNLRIPAPDMETASQSPLVSWEKLLNILFIFSPPPVYPLP